MIIQELLEKRDDLFEIASVLYGDDFVFNEDFWGSQTDRDLQEVYEKLDLFGHEDNEPTEEMIEAAKLIEKMVTNKRNSKK